MLDEVEQIRALVEAVHSQNVAQKKLHRVLVSLGEHLDRDIVTSAFEQGLQEKGRVEGEYVLFSGLALKFSTNGRLMDVYVPAQGSTDPAQVEIQSE